jgi:RHS repeat-associated protein
MPLEPTSFHSLTSCLLYVYGTGNDQPLGVKRLKYAEKVSGVVTPFPAFGWAPHWNVRGQADGGSTQDGGRSPCINASTCLKQYNWPASYSPYAQQYRVRGGWQGTLLEDKRDMSGSLFRRERYLDPASGRFTQEDPAGLAGGMNLYGFAGGDPVNFSDPFGLQTCEKDDPSCTTGAQIRGYIDAAVASTIAKLGALGNALHGALTRLGKEAAIQAGLEATTGGVANVVREIQLSERANALGVNAIRGTLTITGSSAVARIGMIEGPVKNSFGVIRGLESIARSQGASTLRIEGSLANQQLYDVLAQRYGLQSSGGVDFIIRIIAK